MVHEVLYQNHFKTIKKIHDPSPLILRTASVCHVHTVRQKLPFIYTLWGSARGRILGHTQNFILSYSNNLIRLIIFTDEEKGGSEITNNSLTVTIVVNGRVGIQT